MSKILKNYSISIITTSIFFILWLTKENKVTKSHRIYNSNGPENQLIIQRSYGVVRGVPFCSRVGY